MLFAAILFGEKIKIINITQAQIHARLQRSYHQEKIPANDGYVGRPAVQMDCPLKCAAVLVPLTFYADEWHLLFTRRTDTLQDHSGQVSFPGGNCDAEDESFEQTALREAKEEIGLRAEDVQILGRINEVRTVTNYLITPVVGVFPWAYSFFVSTVEVERVFTMPLNWLAEPRHHWQFQHPKAKYPIIAFHPFDGELLWGATARITVNFLKTILS